MNDMVREWDAASYHRLSDPQYGWGRRVLQRIDARGDETILDAGCGSGRLTVELAALVPRGRILAVDLSENMLHQARSTAEQADCRNIRLACADLAALPFDSIADGIFSTAAFHWVADHDALFHSLFVSLKPGGWLIAQCGGGPNLLRLRRRTDVVMHAPEFWEYFRGWEPPQVYESAEVTAARLKHAGFSDIATWLHQEDVPFTERSVYRDFLATVTLHAHLKRVPEGNLRNEFLDRIVELAQQEPDLHLDYWRLNIHARKTY